MLKKVKQGVEISNSIMQKPKCSKEKTIFS